MTGVLLLGSTGSIGTQALDIIAANPDRFHVTGLAASGANPVLLAKQAARLDVRTIGVTDPSAIDRLRALGYLGRILTGPAAITDLIDAVPADVVLNALSGSQGLLPTLRALATGARLALANKESLVAGGPLVLKAAAPGQLVPVDSEHSAIAQCLRSGRDDEVARLVLTASGGPFRGRKRKDLARVTVAEAMNHPTWSMGTLVTINSATMVNKGLELIEAHLLFDVPYDRIDVVVHPQSMIHSMVTFTDGSTIAQASPPDMRLPISLALGWPDRVPAAATPCTWHQPAAWTFHSVDDNTFPAVDLARAAGEIGGCLPTVYNAANEQAVIAFLAGTVGFLSIVDTVAQVISEGDGWQHDPGDVDEVLAAEHWARTRTLELTGRRHD